MELDARTLIFAGSIALVMTVVIVIISSRINKNIHGVKAWATGYLFLAIGMLLQGTQGTLAPVFNVLPSNLMIPIGFYLVLMGLLQYKEQPIPSPHTIIPVILLIMAFHLMVGLGPDKFTDRTIFMSSLCGLITLFSSLVLLRHKNGKPTTTEKFTGVAYAVLTVSLFLRAASSISLPESLYLTQDNPHNHATYILSLVFNIILSFGLIIMPAEKIQLRLKNLANTDYLTGTLSRRAFIDQVNRVMQRNQVNNKLMCLIVFDIDNFKAVNDKHGHAAGDLVLVTLCKNIKEMIRPDDLFSRFGGEEFVLLLTDTNPDQAQQISERLRTQVEHTTIYYKNDPITVTISVGVIGINQKDLNFKDFYHQADQQLYRAKHNGKNQVQFQREAFD